MNKKLLALFLMVVMVLAAVVGLVACDPSNPDNPDNPDNPNKPGSKTNITVWVSELEGVKTMTETQIKAFMDANSDYKDKYNVTVEGVGEGEAATQMITDVASGADIFCFAQDQLGRLVEANALAKLGTGAKNTVTADNDTAGVAAVTLDGEMYAYPLTSDNGYFLYYNTDVLTADDVKDLATMVSVAKEAGQKISFGIGDSAWYTASFFFGAGCHSTWSYNNQTKTWAANDDFNSDKGIIAMKGMNILTKDDTVWADSSNTEDFGAAIPSCAVVSGTWGLKAAKAALGDKMGVAKLPTYNVDGTDYQLGSYSGNKLIGVKPHEKAVDQAFCQALALYLSNKDCQLDRFDEFGWGPSNKAAKAEERVAADPTLKALEDQNAFAKVQGQICGGWWDFAKLLGKESAKDVSEHKAALDAYTASITKYETMPEEAMVAFGVTGAIVSLQNSTENLAWGQAKWADWGADVAMVEGPDGTWTTKVAIVLAAGDKIKVRQGQSWDVCYGYTGDNEAYKDNDGNYVITEDNAGTYKVQLVLTKDADGNVTGTVSLIAA